MVDNLNDYSTGDDTRLETGEAFEGWVNWFYIEDYFKTPALFKESYQKINDVKYDFEEAIWKPYLIANPYRITADLVFQVFPNRLCPVCGDGMTSLTLTPTIE